ncbi:carboxypeptidase regulatory-like domain-containing protein [Polaribacter sp. P097]|uniref:carboxypeptidase regulatory-like domain-containing protein n=1 Tax=Polaribacter sp. P097 TaxID=3117398 RepID=UPI002FE13E86
MKVNYLVLTLAILVGFTSCGGSDDSMTNPITSGNISGSVNLYDESVTQIDNNGMTVKVEGTSISTTTDIDGKFTLTDVPFGTYTLTYEKSGYGTFKRFDVDHNNGNTFIADAPSLGQKSTTSVTNLSINSSSSFPVIITTTTNPVANQADTRYIRFFFSTDANVSSENFDSVLETYPINDTPHNLNISQASLDALGFASGTTVYVKSYGESFWGNQYDDPNLGRQVFPNLNLNSAAAVSFVMP